MTPAIALLEAAGAEFSIHELRAGAGPGHGERAARSLGVPPARVLKTLLAHTSLL